MVNSERHATSRGYPEMGRIAGNANCNTRRIKIIAIVSDTIDDPIDRHENLEYDEFLAVLAHIQHSTSSRRAAGLTQCRQTTSRLLYHKRDNPFRI